MKYLISLVLCARWVELLYHKDTTFATNILHIYYIFCIVVEF
nr:MAG TPA: hypothetical protein [Caudoviricetes sp.]